MKNFLGIPYGSLPTDVQDPDFVPRLRVIFGELDSWARAASFGFARISVGSIPSASGGGGSGSTTEPANGDRGDILVSGGTWTVESWGGRKVVSSVTDLEAAVAGASSGDVIFVAAGTYQLTSGSTLTTNVPNVTICGAGPRSTILLQPDFDTDIISVRQYKTTIEGMTIAHGSTYESNGAGSAGYGRGIVLEQADSPFDNISDVTIRNCHLFNTANWAIFDTGVYSYDVLATPVADSGGTTYSPCYGYDTAGPTSLASPITASCTTNGTRTVTSLPLALANVRVGQILTGTGIPHNTRVVAKASDQSITISRAATDSTTAVRNFSNETQCAVSVGLAIEDCTIGFWNSGGAIHIGYGSTTTRVSGLKTNGYSFGSYTSHFGSATEAITLGQVHAYGATDVVFDRTCIFQSPSDNVTLPDKDATMASFHQTNVANLFGPYVEVLSTNCADSNSGSGGREYWLFTSMNSSSLNVEKPFIRSAVEDPGTPEEGYPIRVWKTSVDDSVGSEIHFKGGIALNLRLWYNGTTRVATAPYTTGDQVASWDRDDFVLRGTGDASIKRPVNIEDFWIVNLAGNGRRPPAVPTGSTISNRTHFRIGNGNRNFRFAWWTDSNFGLTSGVDDMRARTLLAHELKPGIAGYVAGTSGGNGRRQREGLWIAAARDGELKQVPFMRVHSSFTPTPLAGDLWAKTATATAGANNDWTAADFRFHDGTQWRDHVRAQATAGTPTAATDNAIVRYDGTGAIDVQPSGITIADGTSGTLSNTNSGDVTLAGTPDYITISNQVITRGLVDMATDITGDLPYANLTQAGAASRLLGRGSSGGAGDWQDIALGNRLSMSGTTLSVSTLVRSILIPPESFSGVAVTTTGTAPSFTSGIDFPDGGAATYITTTFQVPADLTSGGTVAVLYSQSGTSTNGVLWRVRTIDLTPGTGALITDAATTTTDIAVTPSGVLNAVQISSYGGNLNTAERFFRVVIERDPTNILDSNADTMRFHGAVFNYTATV